MVLVVFQSQSARANPPTDYNHALAANGGVATASGSSGSNGPGSAIDGSTSTYWQSSSTMGWLGVAFSPRAYINEIHIHFVTTIYKSLSLYLDTNANGQYETGEKVWSSTNNAVLDVVRDVPQTYALGMKVNIDAKVGSNNPKIAEFEAYLIGDSDGDGLANNQETSTTYYQDMGAGGMPSAIPDDGVNASANSVSLAQFYGSPVVAVANFTVDHARKTDLTAQVGYWNGSTWIDRYVWDPGRRLDSVSLTSPSANSYVTGTVTVTAAVLHPEITSKVEFRVGGVLQATVTSPVGNNYLWSWNTAGFAEGSATVNATQYDSDGGKAWSQITVNVVHPPQTTWVSPTNGGTVSNTVTVKVTATGYYGILYVDFYVDGTWQADVWSPNSGANGYAWNWNTAQYCTNTQHTLRAVVTENSPLYLTSSPSVTVTTATSPLVCITSPANGAYVHGMIGVVASPTAGPGKSITKVDFYLSGSYQHEATSSPWAWSWNTSLGGDGLYTVSVIATDSASATASASISVHVSNGPGGGGCRDPPCPQGPSTPGIEAPPGQATATLGVLASDWSRGEVDSGSKATMVVDLTDSASQASSAENASRIFRPALPLPYFTTYLQWHLVVRDWAVGTAGNVTAFTLRFEMKSDPNNADTDGDGIPDGTEVNMYHTLPVARDSDLDGLADNYEITPHSETVTANGATTILAPFMTDPTRTDTDGDGLTDGQERGSVSFGMTKVIGEVGVVANLGSGWITVYLHNHYNSPVVLAEPTSFHDTAFGHVRIQAVTDHSFQLAIEKWVSGGSGATESVAYLVLESGDHILPDGSVVEVGTASVGVTPATVTFREPFGTTPLVLVQTQTTNDAAKPVIANRTGGIWTGSFGVRLNANSSASHGTETVGYVAISPQSNPGSLATWTRAEITFPSAQGNWTYPAKFSQPQAPLLLAWMGPEAPGSVKNLGLRLKSATNASATVWREQYGGSTTDTVDFFAFAGPMNITARLTTRANGTGSADTDSDGLSDGIEVNTYRSNPTLKDTDADSIPDNIEVTPQTMTISLNGVMQTITCTTSPTSDDTDGDGVKDPDELNGILDHQILFYDMSSLTDTSHLRDLSGNGIQGSLRGAVNVSGKVGGALQFDGANKYVEAADVADFAGTAPFTVSAWFKRLGNHAYWPEIVSKNTETGQREGWHLFLHAVGYGYDNKIGFERFTAGTYTGVISTTVTALSTWYQATVTYDGSTLRLYVNGNLETSQPSTNLIADHNYPLRIGGNSESGWSGLNGAIDEVRIWDRALSTPEVTGYYNLTNAGSAIVSWMNMETRTSTGNRLLDFGGGGHSGTTTGTTVVEGRSGFALKFAGGTDGVSIDNSSSVTINAGVTLDGYVLLTSAPAKDVSIIARRASFYLNVSSDAAIRWSLYRTGFVVSPLPIPLNRWVRITATATASMLSLYIDGKLVATGAATPPFPAFSSPITIGYNEGPDRLSGAIDEVLVTSNVASAGTISGLGVRGIVLNPNNPDTDGDGLADGQEMYTYTVKTSSRYPIWDMASATTDLLAISFGAPAWTISKAVALVGITHPDMGEVSDKLQVMRGITTAQILTLKAQGANAGQANNFTLYDLFQFGMSRSALVAPQAGVYLYAQDNVGGGKKGQIEYLQLQLTVHTLPNRADTDRDGLNDSEEVNLGSDGYATNPWQADTDADGASDGLEVNGWSWSGPTIIADPSGFKTDPTRSDTDRDGVPDASDRAPLGNLFVEVTLWSAQVYGPDPNDPNGPQPFAMASIQGNTTYTAIASIKDGAYIWTTDMTQYHQPPAQGHSLIVDVPDTASSVSITVNMWSYDSSGQNQHTPIALSTYWDHLGNVWVCNDVAGPVTWVYDIQAPFQSHTFTASGCGDTNTLNAAPLTVLVSTLEVSRVPATLIAPADYSGIYNVTDSNGNVLSQRYTGEPRFVAFVLNVGSSVGPALPHAILVPRSVFFQTVLYSYLNSTSPPAFLGQLSFAQNSTTSAKNADDLQEVLMGGVSAVDYDTLLADLQVDPSGRTIGRGMTMSTDLFLYSLPDNVLRVVGYQPAPSVSRSVAYTFCTSGCTPPPPAPWWEQVWVGLIVVVTAILVDAIVITAAAFSAVTTLLNQVGNWFAQQISTAVAVVKSAVTAAAKVLQQVADWIVANILKLITDAVSSTLWMLRTLLGARVDQLNSDIALYASSAGTNTGAASSINTNLLSLADQFALIPTILRGLDIIITIASAGLWGLIGKLTSKTVTDFIIRTLAFSALTISASIVLNSILPLDTWATQASIQLLQTVGIPVGSVAAMASLLGNLAKLATASMVSKLFLVRRMIAVGLSLASMVNVAIGAGQAEGPAREFWDLLMLLGSMISLAFYYTDSKDPVSQGADFISSIGVVFEQAVIFGAPLVTAGAMLARWQGHVYD